MRKLNSYIANTHQNRWVGYRAYVWFIDINGNKIRFIHKIYSMIHANTDTEKVPKFRKYNTRLKKEYRVTVTTDNI